jgi:hypothetical protein
VRGTSVRSIVGWFALAISLGSLGVLVWDKFLRQARFEVKGDWILSGAQPVLRVVIFNVGYRKGTVRDLRLKERAMSKGRGWTPYERVMSRLPIVLDADEGSEAFLFELQRNPRDIFEDALATSRIDTIEIENARGEISAFTLPVLHEAKSNAMTNAGSEMPRLLP